MTRQCIELESEPCDEGKDCHYSCCDICLCKGCNKAQCNDYEEYESEIKELQSK